MTELNKLIPDALECHDLVLLDVTEHQEPAFVLGLGEARRMRVAVALLQTRQRDVTGIRSQLMTE